MEEIVKNLTKEILDEEKNLDNLLEKAFGMPKIPGGAAGAGPKTPGMSMPKGTGSGNKMTVYWQGEGRRRPVQINVGSPIPQGYGPNPKKGKIEQAPSKIKQGPEAQESQQSAVTPRIKEILGNQINKLKDTVVDRLKGIVSEPKKQAPKLEESGQKLQTQLTRERGYGETEAQYNLALLTSAASFILDFSKRLEGIKVSDPQAQVLKEQVDKMVDNVYKQVRAKMQGSKGEAGGISDVGYEENKNKADEYEKRGLKSLSKEEFADYKKTKKYLEEVESGQAELSQTKSSIEEQKKRDEKSRKYVEEFEKQVRPASEIKAPDVKSLVKSTEKAEATGKAYKISPNKESMLKMNAARFLNRAFKTLKLDEDLTVSEISAKGSAMVFAIKAPMKIGENDLKKLNKLIQRQYGLSSPAEISYKPNNIVEFSFSKQKKEDIIRPMFSNSVVDLNSYISENKTPNGLRRLAAILGYNSKGEPVIADFTNYEATSIGTIASPRQGKTFNAGSALMSMMANYSPEEFKFDVIDAQGVAFPNIIKNSKNYMENEPGMGVKTKEDIQRIVGILESNLQLINDRGAVGRKYGVEKMTDLPAESGDRQFPLKMIMIDEYQGLLTGIEKIYGTGSQEAKDLVGKVQNYLDKIQKEGAKWGVIPWVMTQTVDDRNQEYFKNCGAKILYRVQDPKTGQDFLGKGGRDVARNIIDVGQSAIQLPGKRSYGVGVVRNSEVDKTVTKQVGSRGNGEQKLQLNEKKVNQAKQSTEQVKNVMKKEHVNKFKKKK